MRVLFCKIHCPSFICFCKPSAAAHLYSSGPLKLDNTPHVLSLTVESVVANNTSSDQLSGETIEVKDERCLDEGKLEQADNNNALKSCIRNEECPSESCAPREVEKKRVQWMDNLGKELAEIKEFECSETWDNDYDEDTRGCVCVIL